MRCSGGGFWRFSVVVRRARAGCGARYALDVGHFQIWVKSAIQFYQLDKINGESKIFGAVDQPQPILWPNEGFNTFLVPSVQGGCRAL